jgi:hypothetical protein
MDMSMIASHQNEGEFSRQKPKEPKMCMAVQYKPKEPTAVEVIL